MTPHEPIITLEGIGALLIAAIAFAVSWMIPVWCEMWIERKKKGRKP
jgi:hypothetical protein